MAVTTSRVKLIARKARDFAAELQSLQARLAGFVGYNQSNEVDWAALAKGQKGVDPDGVVEGEDFTIEEVANAIGTFANVLASFEGGHLGNLHKLASP